MGIVQRSALVVMICSLLFAHASVSAEPQQPQDAGRPVPAAASQPAVPAARPGTPPAPQAAAPFRRHIIAGVPFVRWSEAAGWNYSNRDIANPSFPAAIAMVLRYWGADPALLERKDWDEQLEEQGWHTEWNEASGLDEVEALIDRNLPVVVIPAMTTLAHRVYGPVKVAAMLKGIKLKGGERDGLLGPMAALEALEHFEKETGLAITNDSVEFAARVVIGYDQERKTVLLHDPSLGPAWEVPEQDFERMWQFSKRKYWLLYPPNYLEVLTTKTSAPPYGVRAPDNDAAAHYWYGYALESLDSPEEAEQELRSGLQIPGISKGYEHLLRYELARVLNLRGRDEDAIAEARKAIALMPENPAPWDFVAGWARCCGGKNGKKEAAEAKRKVQSLCEAEAQTRFVRTLAVDFDVRGCRGERLGWGVR